MWYAIFNGDGHYHLMKPQVNYTLCGRPTLRRDRSGDDYRPPARVLSGTPPASQYRSCPRCMVEANSGDARSQTLRHPTRLAAKASGRRGRSNNRA